MAKLPTLGKIPPLSLGPAAMSGVGGVTPEKMFEILYRNGAFWSILMITAALLIIKNTRTETLKYRKI